MEIRPATVADADAVADTVLAVLRTSMEDVVDPQLAYEREPEDEADEWRARLADPTAHVVLVACHDDRPVGVAAWLLARPSGDAPGVPGAPGVPDPSDAPNPVDAPDPIAPSVTLTHLAVHPAAQGAGVGAALLRRAEDELHARGPRRARTRLHRDAWWAGRFFAARGWVRAEGSDGDLGANETWERTW